MKAELSKDGTLSIIAENPLEAFALDRWSERFFAEDQRDYAALNIDLSDVDDTE